MKILITGATGLVGKRLISELFKKGFCDINVLTRNKKKYEQSKNLPINAYEWNYKKKEIDLAAFTGVDIIIHLAGHNIGAGRWTKKAKQEILDSRVLGTKFLLESIEKSGNTPKKFISSSAIGFYGDRFDEILKEDSKKGEGFLPKVCSEWENAALAHNLNMKNVIIRTGIVLAANGGALEKMLPPFKMGAGGILGSGTQYMSWIHIEDLAAIFIYALEKDSVEGIINGVSPRPLTNKSFTKVLAKSLSRPAIFPVPKIALKLLLGEMSDLVLTSQKVVPQYLIDQNFDFKFTYLSDALKEILVEDNIFEQDHFVPRNIEHVFDFFSNEKNLEKITPKFLNFTVLGKDTEALQEDTIIDYKLKVHGIPMKWKSQIKNWKENESFRDIQLKGPYSKWDHMHSFYKTSSGTYMTDKIKYRVPFGKLGNIFLGKFIRKDISSIFEYRKTTIDKII